MYTNRRCSILNRFMFILGIESSCDETGLAIYHTENGLLSHVLHSQEIHRQYGGVVPELASRDHVKYLVPLLDETLKKAKIDRAQINAIAYTAGPGLIGALLAGACFAKSLAFALNIPAIAINHLEAHLLIAKLENPSLDFPFVVLLASGGHTQLIHAKSFQQYEILGETLDDAAGEAFDKTAKLLGLAYPNGALLAQLADSCHNCSLAPFPRPMLDRPGLDFSFSGLKTHVMMVWNKSKKDDLAKKQIAKAFQDAVIEVLTIKCQRALEFTQCNKLVIAGGVGANQSLRTKLQTLAVNLFFPRPEFCTDNGAMVAYAGALYFLQGKQDSDLAIHVQSQSVMTYATR